MKKIKFTNVFGLNEYPPVPASKNLPQWYKDTPEYVGGKKKSINAITPHTIKKCIPVFDSLISGYILFTQVDIEVNLVDGVSTFIWPSQEPIGFHPISQAPIHPLQNGNTYPKFHNQYVVETPPGYSTLFTNPMNNPSDIFTIVPGIVDTDKYKATVHFPFVLNNPKWEGVIPAGTAIAQVIPFKRDSWKMSFGSEKEIQEQLNIFTKLKTLLYNGYKRQFWTRKEYK